MSPSEFIARHHLEPRPFHLRLCGWMPDHLKKQIAKTDVVEAYGNLGNTIMIFCNRTRKKVLVNHSELASAWSEWINNHDELPPGHSA